jgi:Flp pilus assembly protein TadD
MDGEFADKKALIADGWSALVKGDGNAALTRFQSALGGDSGSVEANYGQAVALKTLGRRAEAIKAFEETLARLNSIDTAVERVRVTMLKHLAEAAMRDLQAGEGQ